MNGVGAVGVDKIGLLTLLLRENHPSFLVE